MSPCPVGCVASTRHSLHGGTSTAWRARRAMLGFFFVSLAPAAFASQAFAFQADPCLSPAQDISVLKTSFAAQGWQAVDGPNDPVIDALAWIGMPQYFAGDSGGQSKAYVLDLKRKTAAGYFRKKDLPNAQTRILNRTTDAGTEVLLVSWLRTSLDHINITCDFAVSPDTAAEIRAKQPPPVYKSGFSRLPTVTENSINRSSTVQIVFLDRAALEKQLNTQVPASAIVSTSLSYNAKDIKP